MRVGKSRLHSLGSDGLVAVSEGLRLARLLCRLDRTSTVQSMSWRQLESTKTSPQCPPNSGASNSTVGRISHSDANCLISIAGRKPNLHLRRVHAQCFGAGPLVRPP